MNIREISKEDGSERTITIEDAVMRLVGYYGMDRGVEDALLTGGTMQTSFFYYERGGVAK